MRVLGLLVSGLVPAHSSCSCLVVLQLFPAVPLVRLLACILDLVSAPANITVVCIYLYLHGLFGLSITSSSLRLVTASGRAPRAFAVTSRRRNGRGFEARKAYF